MEIGRTVEERKYHAHRGWHFLGTALVIGWLAVLGMQFAGKKDLRSVTILSSKGLTVPPVEGEYAMTAFFNRRPIGTVTSRTSIVKGGYKFAQHSRLTFKMGGLQQRVETLLTVWLNRVYILDRFRLKLQAGPLESRVIGHRKGDRLAVELQLGDRPIKKEWILKEPPLLDFALPRLLMKQDLRPGRRYQVTVFDPQSLSNQPAVIEVIGREAFSAQEGLIPAVHLRRQAGASFIDSWIDERGRVLKIKHAYGLILRRDEKGEAGQESYGRTLSPKKRAGEDRGSQGRSPIKARALPRSKI